jgi:hypothetical protein
VIEKRARQQAIQLIADRVDARLFDQILLVPHRLLRPIPAGTKRLYPCRAFAWNAAADPKMAKNKDFPTLIR